MFNLELSVSLQSVSTKKQGMFITTFKVRENIPVDDVTLTELLTSRLYSTNQWKAGKCLNANFIRMTGITIDIDQNLPLEDAKKIFEKFNYIIHTSTSHKEDMPNKNGVQDRYRVILPFDPVQYDIFNTEALASAVYDKVMDTYKFVDVSCADPARKYFPFLNKQYPTMFELYINDVGNYYSLEVDDVKKHAEEMEKAAKVAALSRGNATEDTYRLKLTEEFLLKDKVTRRKLGDFKPKKVHPFTEPVFCNVCDDINSANDSAFVNFGEDGLPFVHCKHCNKTYRLSLLESYPTLFYLGNTLWRVNPKGDISADKAPVAALHKLGTEARKQLESELYDNRCFSNSTFRMKRQVDAYAEERRWDLNSDTEELSIYIPPVKVDIQDNDYINTYFEQTFQQYTEFIKDYLAILVYQNYQSLPVLVLNGPRGIGKTTFGEMIENIYPGMVDTWDAQANNFTEFLEKKLLLIDEAQVDKKEQYTLIKGLTGADKVKINIKFMPKYRVKNNINIIMTTNNDTPLYLSIKEKPKNQFENQFFMYTFPDLTGKLNSRIKDELAARIGYYIRTESRDRYEAWKADTNKVWCRYGIVAPITPLLLQQFNDARSALDYNVDEVYAACLEGIEIKDKNGNLVDRLGPYEVINSAELNRLIEAMRLSSHNIKSIRERMQTHGYLGRGAYLTKDHRDAWQVIPRAQLKSRNPNGTTDTSDGSSGNPETSTS